MSDYFPGLQVIVEGQTDEAVFTRLLDFAEVHPYQIKAAGGKSKVTERLISYNRSARIGSYWLVVVDLDQDADCAPQHMRQIFKGQSRSEKLLLRIAVHSIESWLMADRRGMAQFLSIPANNFPANPDIIDNPKRFLINLVHQKCPPKQKRNLVKEMTGNRDLTGQGYRYWINRFASRQWRPEVAAQRSDSLARCIRALENLKRQSAQ